MNDTTSTPLADDYDVVVVGARVAGAATALRLARAGLRVAAIDRGGYGADTLSTLSIARAGVLLLSRWGVLDTLRAAGTPVHDRVVFHYGDREHAIDIAPDGDVDGLYAPRRSLLDRELVDAAVDAGAHVRHGTSVVGVVRDPRGRVVGVDIAEGDTTRSVRARWVVGADGLRSRVADQVGAVTLREEDVSSAVIYGYFSGVARPNELMNEVRRGHAAGVIPTNDGETCVWVAASSGRFRDWVADGVETAFDTTVARSPRLAERLDGAALTSRMRTFPGRPGILRQAWGPGWALVGDSGYFKDPVSAHGITDALVGAELLADALITAVDTDDDTQPLARYQHERNRLAAPMIPAVAKVASFDWNPDEISHAYRDMARAMRQEWDVLESRQLVAA